MSYSTVKLQLTDSTAGIFLQLPEGLTATPFAMVWEVGTLTNKEADIFTHVV